jgi:hypothetical protein
MDNPDVNNIMTALRSERALHKDAERRAKRAENQLARLRSDLARMLPALDDIADELYEINGR